MTDYYADRRLSHSKLSCLADNPEKFKRLYVDNPPTWKQPGNDAFAFGHAVHCLALEPDEFDERFVVVDKVPRAGSKARDIADWGMDRTDKTPRYAPKPEINRRTNEGKAQWQAFVDQCERDGLEIVEQDQYIEGLEFASLVDGKEVLTQQEYADAIACVQALNNHPEYAAIMSQPKRVEQALTVQIGGHELKCKPDAIIDSERIILDIKTTDRADPEKWKWSALDYGYDRQAAIYTLAVQQETGHRYKFKFACVEKPTPSTRGLTPKVVLVELEDESLNQGYTDAARLIEEYDYRIDTGDWVGKDSKETYYLRMPKRKNLFEERT